MQLFHSRTTIHRAKERILTVPFIEITSLKGWRPSRVKKRQVGKNVLEMRACQPCPGTGNPNPTLCLSSSSDEPCSPGQWTLPRGPLRIPEGDDSCDPYLPPNCTLRCPRPPVSLPSLITHAVQALSD